MERTIDRTSYRRNARACTERRIEKKRKFLFLESFLNQIIISLIIISFVSIVQYFEINEIENWIKVNMSNGYEIVEVIDWIKSIFRNDEQNEMLILKSGENVLDTNISGEYLEESGEVVLKTVVEGINQMSEDAKFLLDNYEFIIPLKGTVTSVFGCRITDNALVSSYHAGIDIAANTGSSINASHSGTVILAKKYSSYGNCVIIESGELTTLYAHCSSLNVKEGQKIKKGECIAKVGMTGNATGPHLHFEVKYQGRYIDPKYILGEI